MLLLIKLARLWTAAPPSSAIQTLYDVIGGVHSGSLADAEAAQSALATITGWPLSDISAFVTALALSFTADYMNPKAYDAVRTLEQMASTAHATGAQLIEWGQLPADESTAEGIASGALGVVRAQQSGTDAWLALAPSLMNPIRDRRSAALQAYLIGQRDIAGHLIYGDTNGLFDHFLIDVQMSSCQVTSRVVQAYIAVQIFVERCLMNLEAPAVVVDETQDDTWSEWSWMDRYRVWEANREVFLYPENWLIEAQRPSRTEIYKTFEQEVQQGQSTADYLETVVLNYISRLDDLAHLLVTGTCEDPVSGDIHVVARTLADPPVFYHRSYTGGAWGGWTKIPLDIKAHQVAPAIYRRRLCLFWLDREGRQRAPAAPERAAGVVVASRPDRGPLRGDRRALQHVHKRQLAARPVLEGKALRQAVLRGNRGRRPDRDRGALHAQGAITGARCEVRLEPVHRRLPARALRVRTRVQQP